MKSIFFCCAILFAFSACSSYKYGQTQGSVQDSNLTFGMVKASIVKGSTSQDEILKTFGAPNITTKNKSNDEVWSYNKMSAESRGGETRYFVASKASSSSASKSFDLIITFDNNDIVKDYSVIQTSY
jgi:hypothetical protein